MSNKTTLLLGMGMVAFLFGSMAAASLGLLPGFHPATFAIVALIFPFAFMAFQMRGWFSLNKKIVICVNPDGLTVDRWPGDVISFDDVKLGLWTSPKFPLLSGV